jgi:hypothetical protein
MIGQVAGHSWFTIATNQQGVKLVNEIQVMHDKKFFCVVDCI